MPGSAPRGLTALCCAKECKGGKGQPRIYDGMQKAFRPEHAPPGFRARYGFVVEGDRAGPGGSFNINVRDQRADFAEGEPSGSTSLTFRMKRSTFEALRTGALGGGPGFLSGAVQIDGINRMNVIRHLPKLKKFDALFPSGPKD